MLVFYSNSTGKPNVPTNFPVNEPAEKVLEIFRNLSPRNGFIGIILKEAFLLQLMPRIKGITIELLDTSIPAIDFCDTAESGLAEQLIMAAGNGEDVFQIARQKVSAWEHLKMA